MAQAFDRRLEKLEDTVIVGKDRRLFEREKRYYYTLPSLSTTALMILLRAALGEIEIPKWLEAEIYKPIPPDTAKSQIDEATAYAKGCDRVPAGSNDHLSKGINRIIDSYTKTAGRPMATLADVQDFMEEREKERKSYVSQKPSH